jgi:hypothetical protein
VDRFLKGSAAVYSSIISYINLITNSIITSLRGLVGRL